MPRASGLVIALTAVLILPGFAPPAQARTREFPVGAAGLHQSVAPAVVALSCRLGPRQQYFGTGVLIDPSGLILSSVTVVPQGAIDIRVYFRGGRVAQASLLLADSEKEVSLVRIRRPSRLAGSEADGLAWVKLGNSADVRIGDASFTLGNSFRSIENDDQVSIAAGMISGLFDLEEKRSESTYVGPAIETSAALNNGVDGGPLVNDRGELIGLLSLNYSRNRWLGTAVPINEIKPIIARFRGWFDDRQQFHRTYAGIELEEVAEKEILVLRAHEGGAAAAAGLRAGDRLVALDGKPLESLERFREAYRALSPGARLRLDVERSGGPLAIEIVLRGRF
ncbi:MAG: serine protease [Planctomycetes bacterium]|nr:serine protease [Planctomycetota bacterium]